MAKRNPDATITLSIQASFDVIPNDDELQEILEAIRSHGSVDEAILNVAKPLRQDLLERGL